MRAETEEKGKKNQNPTINFMENSDVSKQVLSLFRMKVIYFFFITL